MYRSVSGTWMTLMALTAALAMLGASKGMALLVLAGVGVKGVLIAESFMDLHAAPWWLRGAVLGWLAVVLGGLMLSFSL